MLSSSKKVFHVLEYLCANHATKAHKISVDLDLKKSSVHRFLNTLMDLGYVDKDDEGNFFPSLKILQLASAISIKVDLLSMCYYQMKKLAADLDLTVTLASLNGFSVTVLAREYPSSGIARIILSIELPAYCTGLGKALFARQSDEFLQRYLEQVTMDRYTAYTISDKSEFLKCIENVRKNGFSEEVQELNEGFRCIAVSLPLINGNKEMALSVSGTLQKIEQHGVDCIVNRLQEVQRILATTA